MLINVRDAKKDKMALTSSVGVVNEVRVCDCTQDDGDGVDDNDEY